MVNTVRIIPRLDIKGENLIKGIHLEGLRVIGKPWDFAKYYYENGADELLYMDVVASLYNRNSLHEIIKRTAKEIFIPLTVGGGIRTIDDITNVLRSGADKVSINTAAIKNPQFIKEASNMFGSSTIAVSIEASRQKDGTYSAFIDNGREYTGVEVLSWAKKVEEFGAGEIILTSIDREGTGEGFDLELIKMVVGNVSVPVVACGGAGRLEDILSAVKSGASAVSLASMLHYDFLSKKKVEDCDIQEGNINFLKSGKSFSRVVYSDIGNIKKYFQNNSVSCR